MVLVHLVQHRYLIAKILSAKEAPLLSTLAASIFNVANFLGAIIGSILLSVGLPYIQITMISGGIIVLGMLLNLVNQLYEKACHI